MDTLTHSLVGLTASKAGLEKLSPGTSALCVLAANAPDIDFISGIFGDRWTLLHYHRGITHSVLGTFLLALTIPLLFWLGDLMISRWRRRVMTVHFRGLLLASLVVSVTHPLMDWTNNYGLRPWLPWSGKWFYGDLVFIVDPFLWLVLGATAFLLTSTSKGQLRIWSLLGATLTLLVVFGAVLRSTLDHPVIVVALWLTVLIGSVICRKGGYPRRGGRKVALIGLALVAVYWSGLAILHAHALNQAREQGTILALSRGETVMRTAAMPTLANPTHWLGVVESDRAVYRFELFLFDRPDQAHNVARFAKAEGTEAKVIASAGQDRRAKILLEFARFPIGRVADHDCVTETLVQFADLRYTEPGKPRASFSLELPVECQTHP